jgi:hypothetical protein
MIYRRIPVTPAKNFRLAPLIEQAIKDGRAKPVN